MSFSAQVLACVVSISKFSKIKPTHPPSALTSKLKRLKSHTITQLNTAPLKCLLNNDKQLRK